MKIRQICANRTNIEYNTFILLAIKQTFFIQINHILFVGLVLSKVLVIDDEVMLLKIISRLLERLKIAVDTATEGKIGIDLLKQNVNSYQAIILDYNLQGMSCEEILKAIREISPTIKVIISTGYSAEEKKEQLSAMGIAGVLQKPFTINQLQDVMIQMGIIKKE